MKGYARDPFAVDPLPKAYYHPSPEKRLTRKQRATAISPSRQSEERTEKHQHGEDRVSPMDEIFLRGTNQYQPRTDQHNVADDDLDFDETWPSSERPSSLNLTGLEEESPMDIARFQGIIDRFTNIKQTLVFTDKESPSSSPQHLRHPGSTKHGTGIHQELKQDKPAKSRMPQKAEKKGAKKVSKDTGPRESDGKPAGSVLHRYIERFRNSAPMSREEREIQKQSSSKDFWWLSPSGGSPQSDSPAHDGPHDEIEDRPVHQPLTAENLNRYSQWEQKTHKRMTLNTVPDSPGDKRTIELQERAERLLEKSSSTVLSTDPAVSTEGLGSNMSEMSSLEEYPYRPAFTTYTDRVRPAAGRPDRARVPEFKPTGLDRQQPEDDPLYQWRLRRKIEQAQEMPAKNVQTFEFLARSEKEKRVDEQLDEFKRKLAEKPGQTIHMRPSKVEFTPAPPIVQTETFIQSLPEESQTRPQIASPVLHRRRQGPDRQTEVDPHLHLMCDLLPCPHQSSYREQISHSVKPEASTDADRDKLKQYLEAEKPDIDRENENKLHGDKERVKYDAGKVEDNSDDQNVKVKHRDTGGDNRNSKQKHVRVNDLGQDRYIHKDRKSRERGEEIISSDDDKRYKERKPARSERLPKPRQSSSPKVARRGVDEAIGQVVKDHLFSMSTSTVLSSVESLQPMASTERLPPSSKPVMSSLPEHPNTQTEESDQSDGEFGEDHLLQMLRRQRALYEQQLQEIDSLLERVEAR